MTRTNGMNGLGAVGGISKNRSWRNSIFALTGMLPLVVYLLKRENHLIAKLAGLFGHGNRGLKPYIFPIVVYFFEKWRIQLTRQACSSSFFAIATASLFLLANGVAQAECSFFTGFTDNKDGTVTDTRNGLIWKRCAEGFEWENGVCMGSPIDFNWDQAMLRAQQSRFLDKNDWRLPTNEEFKAVLGRYDECKGNVEGEYAASKAIIAHKYEGYWTSSKLNFTNFYDGYIGNGSDGYGRLLTYNARLVRTGQMLGGEAALEFINEPTVNRLKKPELVRQLETKRAVQEAQWRKVKEAREAQEARQRKEQEAHQRQEAQNQERRMAAFRKSLKEGDDTSSGVIIQVKGNLVKIQTNDSQCSQRDYDGNCKNWINTPVEKWFKRSEVYPQ